MVDEKSLARKLILQGVQQPLSACVMRSKGRLRSSAAVEGASDSPARADEIDSGKESLMMEVVADDNIREAIKRVKQTCFSFASSEVVGVPQG